MRKVAVCLLASVPFLTLVGFAETRDGRPLVFTHAVIVDGNGGAPIEDGTLVVQGSRIESVGPAGSIAIPPGSEVLDLGGKVLMPGLADMHVHLVGGWDGTHTDLLGYQHYLNALLYSGITTVLDLGNTLPFILQLRNEIVAGRIRGPRVYCAGPLIDGSDPLWPTISFSIASAEQIPKIVRHLAGEKVDVLKAYVGLSDRLMSTLVQEARKESLQVFVDQSWRNGSLELIMGDGVTIFAHAPDFPPGPEALAIMKPRGVMFITTLAVVESYSKRRLSDLSFLDCPLIGKTSPPGFLAALRAAAARELGEPGKNSVAHNTQRLRMRAASVKKLFEAGVTLVAGTDAPYPGVFQGEGLHRELELLVEAGLTPLDAITAATRNAARLIAKGDEWGTLEAGRVADLLVINGRPDRTIHETRNIEMVVQRGKIVDRMALELAPEAGPIFQPVTEPISE